MIEKYALTGLARIQRHSYFLLKRKRRLDLGQGQLRQIVQKQYSY